MDSIAEHKVAIILINWNGLQFSIDCLHSLRQLDYPNFGIFVVDNASDNQEGEVLKAEFPEITLIQSSTNLGFAGGNNLGIRKAMAEGYTHLMLLNNDTEVAPDFLGELLRKFNQAPKLAVVQPLIFFLGNRKKIWSAGGKWEAFLGRAITLGDRKSEAEYTPKDRKLDWATGCCLLIKREAIEATGLLNEQYFAYFEDVEWSLRFRAKGFEIELASKSHIYHEAGASSKSKHSEGTLSPRVFYFHVRNQLLLIRAQVNSLAKPFAFGYHLTRFTAWMLYFGVRGRFQKLKNVAKGIRDGFTEPLQSSEKWH